jgi:hypothetical protein
MLHVAIHKYWCTTASVHTSISLSASAFNALQPQADLTALGDVPLHPLLAPRRAAATASTQSSSPTSTTSISPRRVTLLDCVPIDKERALLAACTETHRNILRHIAQTHAAWAEISAGVAAQQQAALPPLAAAVVQGTSDDVHSTVLQPMHAAVLFVTACTARTLLVSSVSVSASTPYTDAKVISVTCMHACVRCYPALIPNANTHYQ